MSAREISALQRKVRAKQRTIRKAREAVALAFMGVLPRRGSYLHRHLRWALRILGYRFKTDHGAVGPLRGVHDP